MTAQLASTRGAAHAAILGVGGYRPERVVDNAEICRSLDSSDEWIRERSGIVTRHFAAPDETVIDMAEAASRQALESAGRTGADVDAVIMATVTHPYQTPAAAPTLAYRLGAQRPAAFDISAACAGFCHGVGLAQDMIRSGSASHVLVVGVEKLTDFVDITDRGTGFLFADGAGAVLVGPSEQAAIGPTVWGSDGDRADAIVQNHSWNQMRAARFDPEVDWPALRMAGQSVFRWAVWAMAPVALRAVEVAGITLDDLDVFIPHQANVRIIDALVKQLRLPAHIPVARDIADTGNTSAASIPLAMRRMLDDGVAKSGDLALLIGFGAGLVYAAHVVRLP